MKRGGAEGHRIKKEAEKQAHLKRKENTRDERKMLVIACEDSVSAPLYFNALFDKLKKNHAIAAKSLVIAEHKHTDPCGVLQDLLNYPNYKDFDHQWIVIDRDEERTNGGGHPLHNFNNALNKAVSKKIEVAYSNPCFEIWYLLHFEYRDTPIDRDSLNDKLSSDHQYAKNELFVQVLNQELQDNAIENSERLIQSFVDINGTTNPATDNPTTTVHVLVKLLKTFAKPDTIKPAKTENQPSAR